MWLLGSDLEASPPCLTPSLAAPAQILALDDLEKLLVTSLEEVANQSATVPIGMLGQADDEELVNCDTSSKMDNTTDMHEAEDSDLSSVDAHEDSEAT